MRILIADDNVDLAESLSAVLRSRGTEVRLVDNGRDALAEARRWLPDVLLLDLKMPGLSGLDVIAERNRDGANGRVIAMTGYDSAERIAAAERLGAETVLRKPFSMMELLTSLGLQERDAQPDELEHCLVLVLADSIDRVPVLPRGCTADFAPGREALLSAAGDREYDAVMLLRPELVGELTADLAHLDPDIAVVPSTERALLETAVRQTRGRRQAFRELSLLRGIVTCSPGAFLAVVGVPPRIERWSREVQGLLGYRDDELADADLQRLEPALVPAGLSELVAQARASGTAGNAVVPVRVRGGAVRPLRVVSRPLPGAQGCVLLAFSAPEMESRHDEDLRVLGATAAGVAHEMRNALAGVGSSLSVLQARFADSESGSIVAELHQRVERAAETMNDLLDFARPVTLRLMAVPAPLVLEAAADEIRSAAPADVRVTWTVSDPSMRLLVDPVRLQMALVNLGNNAAQALNELGGSVAISCVSVDEEVWIQVDDDGPGVPATVAGQIFEPFFTTRPRGSGLGLANVRKLVEAHGGRISLLPDRPGAHFLITLPRRPRLRDLP
jgi:signal transduction histidine kinase/ActR/RegA family two-component response regulator